MSTLLPYLTAVRNSISKKQPFCTGTYPLANNSGRLFFLTDGGTGAHCIDLANADDAKLQTLVGACEQAVFGVDNKDVLDETYRKAWKMDSSDFSPRLDVVNTGIIDHVCTKLMQGNTERKIRPEMYKLNVYGPGSFFKAHKDTPRSENMFGSLVVVFPTRHEGGALRLRHKDEEWTFDSAAMTSAQEIPSIAYIAFYSDVEHEVSMVTSGYRVSLTYNLYFDNSTSDPSRLWRKEEDMALHASLSALLERRDLLPDGGYLGFGLDFMYPVAPGGTKLITLINSLKGSDAMIKRVLDQFNLVPQLKVVYEDLIYGGENGDGVAIEKVGQVMLDDVDRFPDWQIDESLVEALSNSYVGGIVICSADEEGKYKGGGGKRIEAKKVLWITPPSSTLSRVKSPYVAYGNEAELGYSYGNVCLVVAVPATGKRVKATKHTDASQVAI